MPLISNCMAIGDRMKFLSMLVTLKTEVDEEGLYIQTYLQTPKMHKCINAYTMKIIHTFRYTYNEDFKYMHVFYYTITRWMERFIQPDILACKENDKCV